MPSWKASQIANACLSGMTIDGVLVSDLFAAYAAAKGDA